MNMFNQLQAVYGEMMESVMFLTGTRLTIAQSVTLFADDFTFLQSLGFTRITDRLFVL